MGVVIGGAMREAQELIQRRRLKDATPIDDPEALRGLNAPHVSLTGTFIARADVQAFYDVFKRIHAKHQFVP